MMAEYLQHLFSLLLVFNFTSPPLIRSKSGPSFYPNFLLRFQYASCRSPCEHISAATGSINRSALLCILSSASEVYSYMIL